LRAPREEKEAYSLFESEDTSLLSPEQKKEYLGKIEGQLFECRLDSYTLPQMVIKVIKSMKKNGVVEVSSSRIDKFLTNFANEAIGFD